LRLPALLFASRERPDTGAARRPRSRLPGAGARSGPPLSLHLNVTTEVLEAIGRICPSARWNLEADPASRSGVDDCGTKAMAGVRWGTPVPEADRLDGHR